MSFRFSPTVQGQLDELWRWVREFQQANTIGHSSLGPRDGGLLVLDSAGRPLGQVGTEGGVGGLLVPDGAGGWKTVQADAQERVDKHQASVAAEIAALKSRVSRLETA